jgi:hypothetical protein
VSIAKTKQQNKLTVKRATDYTDCAARKPPVVETGPPQVVMRALRDMNTMPVPLREERKPPVAVDNEQLAMNYSASPCKELTNI